ncbi:MAG TPA: hypothetical protein PLB01_00020 [Thermoanaerobaculia bacterium]|nr:hypothetical protein [Thermoanaerobaculia bacterium]
MEAVEHVRDEVILRIDASDKITDQKIGRVADKVDAVEGKVTEAKQIAATGIAETHIAIGNVKGQVEKVDAKVSTVQLTVAKMIGWAAGAGAVAGAVVGIVVKLLSHS